MPSRGSAMKRPAAEPLVGRVAKRPAKAEDKGSSQRKLIDLVASKVRASSHYPGHLLEMLSVSLPGCIGVPKEKRHHFQEEVAGMVGEVLGKTEEHFQEGIATEEAKLAEVTAKKAELEAAEKASEDELSTKGEALQAAQSVATEAVSALNASLTAMGGAEVKKHQGTAKLKEAEARKAKLSSTLNDAYLPLKEGTSDSAKGSLAIVLSVGKEFAFDATMLGALPSAAAKAPSDRGHFDALVIQQLQTEFDRCMSALEETIADLEPSAKELQAKVEELSAEVEKAKSASQECQASLEAAKAAQKEALAAKKAASKALSQCEPELKKAEGEVDSAKSSLQEFRDGPLAAYKELLEHTLLVPVEEAKPAADEAMKDAGETKEAGEATKEAEAEAATAPAESAPSA